MISFRKSPKYPDNWNQIRHHIFQRDRYVCQMCGRAPPEVKLHCHHIYPIGLGGPSIESNLITLCKDCHRDVHQLKLYHIPKQLMRKKGYGI